MSDWKRVTREVAFENLGAEMAAAIQQHIEQHNLGPILTIHRCQRECQCFSRRGSQQRRTEI